MPPRRLEIIHKRKNLPAIIQTLKNDKTYIGVEICF